MQIINSLDKIRELNYPWALALGNFDGVHLGHQTLLRCSVQESRNKGWVPSVLLWEPQPQTVLCGQRKYLNTLRQKLDLMNSLGLKYVFQLPFNRQIATLTPENFVVEYLLKLGQVQKVFVGFNYSFGSKASGTALLLKTLGQDYGFAVEILAPINVAGEVVSSSLIREKYASGAWAAVTNLLGYYPFLEGEVVWGEQRGRKLGYPTANLQVATSQVLPARGVYVAYAQADHVFWPALVNIGQRPTFNGQKTSVEAHLLNFSRNIYQKKLKLFLMEKLRAERKFIHGAALQKQINLDLKQARQIFQKVFQ